jgi:hypothetical protein
MIFFSPFFSLFLLFLFISAFSFAIIIDWVSIPRIFYIIYNYWDKILLSICPTFMYHLFLVFCEPREQNKY